MGYAKNYIITNIKNSLDGSNLISDGKTEKVKMRKVGETLRFLWRSDKNVIVMTFGKVFALLKFHIRTWYVEH